jgi:MFS family permease
MELKHSSTNKDHLGVFVLVIFAAGYLLSSQLRGVTAALAPMFTTQFAISPAELGLLAGSYFASFAIMQLPMGALLDRFGVRAVLVVSLSIAALSCFMFAAAGSYVGLFGARLLSGVGVSACLIAPLTAARLWTTPAQQQRLNSWMLMAGALGLVLGTLPSESIATSFGWPSLFIALGFLFAVVAFLVALKAPRHQSKGTQRLQHFVSGYLTIVRTGYTWKLGALGFFNYAILVAVQTLWIGPWLTQLRGEDTRGASLELLYINVVMLITFLIMGYLSPKFNKSARDGEALLRRWTPVSVALLMFIASMGSRADWYMFALYCISAWPLSVTHPLVGQRSQPSEAGRAIAFFNLLLFVGVFLWQWSFGSVVSWLSPSQGVAAAYQIAMGALAGLSAIGYCIFIVPSKALAVDSLEAQALGATPKHNT